MIRFKCPQCGGVLESPESNSGDEINCLGCGYRVQIPCPEDDFFRFTCPQCGKGLKAKPEHRGRKTRCTNCCIPLLVPTPKGCGASKPGPSHAPSGVSAPPGSSSSSPPAILIWPGSISPEIAHRTDWKACPFCGEQVLVFLASKLALNCSCVVC
jgi:DNA-directed RNA polymerase subunit RPC12/RpoP